MQWRETETLSVLDHHDCRFGHIDADLDYRGCHKNLRVAALEAGHRLILVGALQAAVHEPDFLAENALEIGVALGRGGKTGGLAFLHTRKHQENARPVLNGGPIASITSPMRSLGTA